MSGSLCMPYYEGCSTPDQETASHQGASDPDSNGPLWTHSVAPAHSNRGACGQFPLGTTDYTNHMALPLSKSAARSFYEKILSVCW